MWQKEFAELIKNYCVSYKNEARYFSYRAISKRLGISISTLSYLINDKKAVTPQKAKMILSRIDNHLSVNAERVSRLIDESTRARKELDKSLYEVVLGWKYLAICSVLELSQGGLSPEEIADALEFPIDSVQTKLNKLQEAGLVEKISTTGRYTPSQISLSTTDEIPNKLIVAAHKESLANSIELIETIPHDQRDCTQLIVTGDSKKLSQVKQLIRKLHKLCAQKLESSSMDQVYQIQIQVLPLVKNKISKRG